LNCLEYPYRTGSKSEVGLKAVFIASGAKLECVVSNCTTSTEGSKGKESSRVVFCSAHPRIESSTIEIRVLK